MRSTAALLAIACAAALAGTACGPNNAGNTDVACSAISTSPATRPPQWTGSVFVIVMENHDDPNPGDTISATSHLADEIEAGGLTWKTYQESMGAPCGLSSHGEYAVKHNPFVYFSDINGWDGGAFRPGARCMDHVVDYSQ